MLKKAIIGLSLVFSSALVFAQSQNKTSRISVGVEPIYLLIGGLGANVDYALTKKTSVGLFGSFGSKYYPEDQEKGYASYNSEFSMYGVGGRMMLTGDLKTNGAYVAPSVGYASYGIKDYGTFKLNGSLASGFAQAIAGYQWVNQENGFRIGAGAGVRAMPASDIIIRDEAGVEVHRAKASAAGGLALDLNFGLLF